MIKLAIHVLEIYIIAKVLYKIGMFFFSKKFHGKRHKKSIAGKIAVLLYNKVHAVLDVMTKKQKAKRPATRQAPENVVPFKRYSKAK